MDTLFNLAEDESKIFLAEANEHLQTLDGGLVRLEKDGEDANLLQAIFRAAHTLKGAAGAIGHHRMTQLTHAMETTMDGLRKGTLKVSAELVDTLLVSLDILRVLLNEVVEDQLSAVNTAPIIARLSAFAGGHPVAQAAPAGPAAPAASDGIVAVRVEFAPHAFASAARAFQVINALRGLGEIKHLDPGPAVMESMVEVSAVSAQLATTQSAEAIRKVIAEIPDVQQIAIGGVTSAPGAPKPANPETSRLGEFLVGAGFITQAQLDEAIREQIADLHFPPALLGQTLVKQRAIEQDTLDRAIAAQMAQLKSALQAAQATAEKETARAKVVEQTVRISVERLDRLMTLVGELITGRNRLCQLHHELEQQWRSDPRVEALGEAAHNVGRLTDQLQEEVMRVRMLPIATVFSKFPRLIRDLARQTGKQVELVIRGEDTELDRTVIEAIGDPLLHMVRNSVDHGLETPAERHAAGKPAAGNVNLAARQEEGRVIITVADDGKGINGDKVAAMAVRKGLLSEAEAASLSPQQKVGLIFLPGLTTASAVSDLSGRGVGMDIVRANIEKLNGNVSVETQPGKGSVFTISLPLTLAILPALLVQVRSQRARSGLATFAVPLATVMEALHVAADDIHSVNNRPVMQHRGSVLPLVKLSEVLELEQPERRRAAPREYVVAVRWGKQKMGLRVDKLVGEQEVVLKHIAALNTEGTGLSGAAILGDGQVALIADVPGLFKLAGA
jgi:two-component system chemotaxis sensor kinase CheA